ncbi:ATPase [Nocardioides maradonensis]
MAFAKASHRQDDRAPLFSRWAQSRRERRERKELQAPYEEPKRRRLTKAEREGVIGQLGPKGWRLAGGGRTLRIMPTPEFRATVLQVCGLYPFVVGSSLPLIGTPLGEHLEGRGWVCGDPMSWFLHGMVNNPSGFIIARRGVGKSTLIRRIAGFLPYKSILPMALSDWKPDYVELIKQMDGQHIALNRADSFINPLDPGPVAAQLPRLPDDVRARVSANIRGRRINVAVGLCALALGRDLAAHERNMLSAALAAWDEENPGRVPVFGDVQALVKSRHPRVRIQAQDRGQDERYDDRAEGLLDALNSLTGGSEIFGEVFAHHTTTPLEIDKPVVFDLSAFEEMDPALQAGVQLVCWTYGSTALAAAKSLADAGLAPRRIYLLIMDELWRALRAAEFMVDRVDEITRLNRTMGLGQLLCTHGMDDLKLHNEEATAKAWGFVAASEMVYMGGLNPGELGNLEEVFAISDTEKEMLTGWAQIGEVDPETGEGGEPVGKGKFLIKSGKRPGIPFRVNLTPVEIETGIHDTNKTFEDAIAAARRLGSELLDAYAAG